MLLNHRNILDEPQLYDEMWWPIIYYTIGLEYLIVIIVHCLSLCNTFVDVRICDECRVCFKSIYATHTHEIHCVLRTQCLKE